MAVESTTTSYASIPTTEKSTSSDSSDRLAMNKDDFLLLLIESLKNQDPMSPMDTQEMMSQMAQLTTVEQITNMSSTVDKLAGAVVGSQLDQASSMLGKKVSALVNGELIVGTPTKAYLNDEKAELLINDQRVLLSQIREIDIQ